MVREYLGVKAYEVSLQLYCYHYGTVCTTCLSRLVINQLTFLTLVLAAHDDMPLTLWTKSPHQQASHSTSLYNALC